MGRHKRAGHLTGPGLDSLLRLTFDYWQALGPVCRDLDTGGEHHRLTAGLMLALADFMREVSGGTANVAHRWTPPPRVDMRAVAAEVEASAAEAPDDYSDAVAEAVRLCGGDALAAVKALLVANEFLEFEAERLAAAVSHGYVHGRKRNEG